MQARVLHIIDHTIDGGAQESILRFICELRTQVKFFVAVLGKPGRYSNSYKELGVSVLHLASSSSRWSPMPLVPLVKLIREKQIDIVHTHLFRSHILGTLAAKRAGVRTIIHDHTGIYPGTLTDYFRLYCISRAYISAYRMVLGLCDRVLVLTLGDLGLYLKLHKQSPNKLRVLPNGTYIETSCNNHDLFHKNRVQRELQLEENAKIVISIGRLEPVKDFGIFLLAAKQIQESIKYPCAFVIAGEGSKRAELQRMAENLTLRYVYFLGYRYDVSYLLRAADVFVLSSRREAFSLALLEAMAAGCPVVATETSGPKSIITPGFDGLLSRIGDSADLKDHVLRLLADNELYKTIAFNAAETAKRHYDIKVLAAQLKQIYSELVMA
jgi:glycosyltransferase involved in cell wall biosynthesis